MSTSSLKIGRQQASMDLSQNITYERTRNKIPNEDSYLAAAGWQDEQQEAVPCLFKGGRKKGSKRHFSKRESVFSTSRQENREPHARYAKEELGEKQRRNAFLTFCNKSFHQDESRSNINDIITLWPENVDMEKNQMEKRENMMALRTSEYLFSTTKFHEDQESYCPIGLLQVYTITATFWGVRTNRQKRRSAKV